jgi:hypothetical protein
LPDSGDLFGDRGNGFQYGWSSDHTDLDRDRNENDDQRLDTLLHFHAGQNWQIALPNGSYAVTASIGDAGNNSTHTLQVEGVSYWQSETLGANEFEQRTLLVTVDDGHLTLEMGSAAEKATRINYLEIVPTSEPGLFPESFADFDQSGTTNGRDVMSWLRGYGKSTGATKQDGDADGDQDVDRFDLVLWESTFGLEAPTALPVSAASSYDVGITVPLLEEVSTNEFGLPANLLLAGLDLASPILVGDAAEETGQSETVLEVDDLEPEKLDLAFENYEASVVELRDGDAETESLATTLDGLKEQFEVLPRAFDEF